MADEKILNMILDNFKDLKIDMKSDKAEIKEDIKNLTSEIKSRFENIETSINDVVKKKDCEVNRANCTKLTELEVVRSEWSYKKIGAVGAVITATLTGSTAAIIAIIKAIYG